MASEGRVEPLVSLEVMTDWLRDVLRKRLEELRNGPERPRAELDVLLASARRCEAITPPIPRVVAELAAKLELRLDDQAIIAVLLAAAYAPELGRSLALLCDPLGREAVTREAVTALLGLPRTFRLTGEDGVIRWSVIVQNNGVLALDPTIEARLLGRSCRDPVLVEHIAVIPIRRPLPLWPVEKLAEQVHRAIRAGARGVRLWLRGSEGSGRRALFAAIARSVGLTAVAVAPDSTTAVLRPLLRLARLEGLAIAWSDRVRLPADLPVPALDAWLDPDVPPPPVAGVAEITVRMPIPDRLARDKAWRTIVPAYAGWSDSDRELLLTGWTAHPGQLVDVALSGAQTPEEAIARLRADATQRIEGHCEILETPFTWEDIVLPTTVMLSLRELASEARTLPRLWEEPEVGRLFPQGRSVAALFSGPPGSGKTMAAQVIARELALPLFRIDLSRIVSKYIGETSQNLARVLGAARHTDAVVFFDEADALFGTRTEVRDAHDRYANTETDYLLQALDAWRGVALLATNRRANIDPAFMRRMRVILEFPRAEASERERLWTRLATAFMPERVAQLAPILARTAARVEISGAQIKSALLTARAAALHGNVPVAGSHIVRGIARELEKEGRGLSPIEHADLIR